MLLRAPANSRLPHHDHNCGERTAVLVGTCMDGVTISAGDFVESQAGSGHRLRVTGTVRAYV